MLKKRLVGVVTVRSGWAVQSFGYQRYLPLGKPECLIENLDRWGADEILLQVIDRSRAEAGPDFELLERVGALGLQTPLIYCGGIRSIRDGVRLIQLGADRIAVDALLHDDPESVRGLADRLGAQALLGAMPLSYDGGSIQWLDYRSGVESMITPPVLDLFGGGVISELLAIDWRHEGHKGAFDPRLVEEIPLANVPVVAFGGISEAEQIRPLLRIPHVAAVAVGNFLSYREHAIQKLREGLAGVPLRLPSYHSSHPLLSDA